MRKADTWPLATAGSAVVDMHVQCNTTQHNTIQYNTIQYNAVQYAQVHLYRDMVVVAVGMGMEISRKMYKISFLHHPPSPGGHRPLFLLLL